MTGQVSFDSHARVVLAASVEYVNRLTPGYSGGVAYDAPADEPEAVTAAVAGALTALGYSAESVPADDARRLVQLAGRMRTVFEAASSGDLDSAAVEINALLVETNARPQLDRGQDRPWSLHFHGPDEQLANGWAAGCAAGLALAVGSDLGGRLGVCAAPQCDRVFVDVSKNGQRRFCSPQCQSRVKAAAHRARQQAGEN
ncbi:CGNR zinc finger domain-containing protein [Kribbella solani]|uniref:Putative RNA-binding Zn ribbon-like protein n=1 Tax=Kribbella solani TaxID=236067 RepID=A0A841DYN7_9ACTN|nr:CGNR zinc finger domain-containing protein [Kribbella solani]MBB5983683.1 putative RNA-binding Zn ribbon-like protein [Kribbella solani]MDX2969397.1 CGNR zinc finger domain-containing protein [Kribbella solani]MDX3002946.1 CGNR zinc finger domain-containing protein [Kribbella solani]